jgi:Spherulation-specific family 4
VHKWQRAAGAHSARRTSVTRMWTVAALGVAVVTSGAWLSHTALGAAPRAGIAMRLGVPAYVFPGQPPLATLQNLASAPGIVILNPGNGDAQFTTSWQTQAASLAVSGVKVLGYVHTDEGTRPLADVEASINNYLKPASGRRAVSGIFLDEMSDSCSAESYYAGLYSYIRSVFHGAFVAANPGTPVNVCFLNSAMVANTFVTFEHDAATYQSGFRGNVIEANGVITPGAKYPPKKFWHLIYGATSAQMPAIISLAAVRNAGYVYATDADLPNPWDSVASYISSEASAVAAPPSRHSGGS